jgi:alkylated DNA repair dioxygenase AlkB
MEWIDIALEGASLRIAPQFARAERGNALLLRFSAEIPWEQHRVKIYGREIDSPRLSCWIGDPEAHYAYSGTRYVPHPWPETLRTLKAEVESACDARFNSVLANLYRDGRDSMGWHADDETELGAEPVIASLSLGAERRFCLRDRAEKRQRLALNLAHGSLLLMAGATQRNYQHALPKTARPLGPRLNLTFRWVGARGAG